MPLFFSSFLIFNLGAFAQIPSPTNLKQSVPTLIVTLGDSLTEGYGVAKEKSYPRLVEAKLKAAGYNVRINDSSISGSTTASLKNRMNWVLKQKPRYLFIAMGANDGLRGLDFDLMKKQLREAIQTAKAQNINVWLAGMRMPPNYGPEYTKKFAQTYKDLAREEKVPLLPFLLEGVAAKSELNQPDKIHPNERGHEIMSEHVFQFFKKNLGSP